MAKRQSIGILVLILLLTGCAGPSQKCEPVIQYIEKPVEVKVPVMVKPNITIPKEPSYPINNITKSSSDQEVTEAYYKTVFMQRDYIVLLKKTLEKIKLE